ncbi:MAG: 23S rRNA (pseudouridine(1915)-N(3))-methyltransferase RlmH [Tissierellia bacterium]|nr:23S rRNA (pseudouridine(1915)-N(3))-methyltransferase RlmH [Tissierellia bacterium]
MRIKIIAVGNLKEKFLKEAATEYHKRLTRYGKVEIVEVVEERLPENASDKEIQACLAREEDKILKHISEGEYVVQLAIDGHLVSSEELALRISDLMVTGTAGITFVIGSSHGLGLGIERRSNFSLSLSKMTFPHQLTRIILMEQVYRSFKIINNEPYHK